MRLYFPAFKDLPKTTQRIIAVCVILYLVSLVFGRWMFGLFGLVPYKLINNYYFWQPFTYMFLHGNFLHLFGNMFMFWMIGPHVERVLGQGGFIRFVLVTGVFAGLFQTVLGGMTSVVPIVGISGVVFGLLAAFALFYPNQIIYVYFVFPMKTKYFVLALFVLELLMSFNRASLVANIAHVGGFVAGLLYFIIPYWLLRHKTKKIKQPQGYSKERTDEILDKINKHGMKSLTREELDYLNRFSGRA